MNRRIPSLMRRGGRARRVERGSGAGVPEIPLGRTADLVPGDSPSQLFVDQSGNGVTTSDAATADAPTRIESGVFGLPTLRGDGVDDGLRVLGLAHAGASHTFSFLCAPQENLPLSGSIFFFEGRGTGRLACELRQAAGDGTLGVFNNAHRDGFAYLPASNDGATDPVLTTADQLITFVLDGATSELLIFRGRELVGVSTYTGQALENTNSMALFAQHNGTAGECQIDIARVQTWDRALSPSELSDFFDAMQDAVPGSAPRLTRVMMAGDSLTQGIGATAGNELPTLTRGLLDAGGGTWRMVGDQGASPNAHFGRSGDAIADQASLGSGIFTRLGVGTDYRPEVVHLLIGTNDCEDNGGADYDATATIAALETLVDDILLAEPGVRVVVGTPPPIAPTASSAYDTARDNLADLAPKIRSFAAGRNIPVADYHAATWVAGDYDDSVHWNDTGYAKAAAIAAPAIRLAEAATAESQAKPGTTLNAFFLGHSLLGFEIPNVVERLADETTDVSLTRDVAIGIGANLQFQWNNPGSAGGDNPSVFLQAGPYDALILTEAVPIQDQVDAANSVTNALNFMGLAYAENASVQTYLYETWEDRSVTGGLRAAIRERRTYYEEIVTGINAGFAGADVRVIPGGQALGALLDAIADSAVPDLTNPDDLFVVEFGYDIHPTELLIYFLGCVHYATLYQRTPVGLPASLLDRYGTVYASVPTAGMAAAMQAIAWAAVQAEPHSGVDAVAGVPTVASMTPAGGATDVDVAGNIVLTFSEDMNAATIYGETLRLTAGGTLVGASYTVVGDTVTINPSSDLTGDTLYTITATTEIQDDTGVNMTGDRSLSFTTGSVALPPELNTTSPGMGATGASRWAGINIFYFQDIEGSTVDDVTFLVTVGGVDVPGTRSVSGGTISFSPTVALAPLTEYRVQLTADVMGVAPRGAIAPLDYVFTTSA